MLQLRAADGHEFEAFEAGNINAPRCLVVLQEIFGVNAHIRAVSERLASYGYRVLAPALFDRAERSVELGYDKPGIDKGIALRAQISEAQTLLDLEATAAAFGAKPAGAHLGVNAVDVDRLSGQSITHYGNLPHNANQTQVWHLAAVSRTSK